MYLRANVTKWQSSKDSQRRIAPMDGTSRAFILNPSRMSEITTISGGSRFLYTERYNDRREAPCYIEVTQSLEEIITAYDTVGSETLTLSVHRNNNVGNSTHDITIPADALIYADRYNADPLNKAWVAFEEGNFKIKDGVALVDMSLEEVFAGTSLLRDYDDNPYTTVTIGAQEWIVENLRVKHYANGTDIPNLTDDDAWAADTTGAYCYYENDATNFNFIGLLYNWYATDNPNEIAYFTRSGVQEAGWRVPTVTDWENLITAIGGADQGNALKEVGTTHWTEGNEGTDTYGFSCISGGNRWIDLPYPIGANNGFYGQGEFGDHWTKTEVGVGEATGYYLTHDSSNIIDLDTYKYVGQNIRCVRDV